MHPPKRRASVLLGRALRLRCPNCGQGRLFSSWLRMVDRCGVCGLLYERGEHDAFIGAYMLNLIIAELYVALLMLVLILATWPAVPWHLLPWGIALLTIPAVVATYPFSRSLWLGIDLIFRPADPADFGSGGPDGLLPPEEQG